MTHAADDPLATELRAIIAEAEALEGVSRHRPDAFHLGKDSLVRRLEEFYLDLRGADARVARRPGQMPPAKVARLRRRQIVGPRGRVVQVETRHSA